MSKWNEFWNLGFLLVFLRIIDAYLTYTITPDLSFEANPLVKFANQGWTMLLLVNLLVVILSLFLLYLSIHFPTNSYPIEKDYSFKEFISHYLYYDKYSFHKIYLYVPNNKKAIISFCGFIFPRVFIKWSLIVISHNLLLMNFEFYLNCIQSWNLWLYIYILLLPLTCFYFWKFFHVEYRKYLSGFNKLEIKL